MKSALIVELEFELDEGVTRKDIIYNIKEALDCFPCNWGIRKEEER